MGIINLFLTRKNVFFLAILLLFCFLQDLVVRLFWNTVVSLSIGDSIIPRFLFFLQKLHWLWYLKIFLCVICWRYFLFFIIVWYRLFSSDLVCGLWEIKFKNYFGLQPWISENYVLFFLLTVKYPCYLMEICLTPWALIVHSCLPYYFYINKCFVCYLTIEMLCGG